jgi:hypothetical protein
MFLQANRLIVIERGLENNNNGKRERSSRIRRRNESLQMKTPSSSSSIAMEVQRIIIHEGFAYFPIVG